MTTIVSTSTMIERLSGKVGTKALSEWETKFVQNMVRIKDMGHVTALTEPQLESLEELHDRIFA